MYLLTYLLNEDSTIERLLTSPSSTVRYVYKPSMDFARPKTEILVRKTAVYRIVYTANIIYICKYS